MSNRALGAAAAAAAAVGAAVWIFAGPRRSAPTPGANEGSAPARRSRLRAALEQRSVHAPAHSVFCCKKKTCLDPWGKLVVSSQTCPVDNQKDMAHRFPHLGARPSRSSRLACVCPACADVSARNRRVSLQGRDARSPSGGPRRARGACFVLPFIFVNADRERAICWLADAEERVCAAAEV